MKRIDETIRAWLDPAGMPPPMWPWLLAKKWPEIVGERMARETLPGKLDQGELTVHFRQKSWQDALAGTEQEIIGQIRQRFPGVPIVSLRFACYPRRWAQREAPGGSSGPPRPSAPRPVVDWQPASAASIGNERLRSAFLRAVKAYYENGGGRDADS